MKSQAQSTLPTTIEGLEKVVRRIVAEALQSTAEFCRQMDELPTTGDPFLDEAIDNLDPAAQAAIVALLRRHGQDDQVDRARARLEAHIRTFASPESLRRLCEQKHDAPTEDAVRYWVAFGN